MLEKYIPGVSLLSSKTRAGASFDLVPRKLEWPRADEGRTKAIAS
jgi:hypothetical protein